jgi:phosphoserine aminotransferase
VRPLNFGAGPATLPEPVLIQAAAEMLDWHGAGLSVMEMSHRGREFGEIIGAAEADLRRLLSIPENYRVLFMQGGGIAQNAIVPFNLLEPGKTADFVHTGAWSGKSRQEAGRYGKVHTVATSEWSGFDHIPPESDWRRTEGAAYLQICGNETIGGVQFHFVPKQPKGVPLVADLSSEIMSRPVDVTRYGLIYAGAQKNLGVAGLTLVIINEELLGRARHECPSVFNYSTVAKAQSMVNTPPTYAIYIAGLVLKWLLSQGEPGRPALEVMRAQNQAKSSALYGFIDTSGFYHNRIRVEDRSTMNVPFTLADEQLNAPFLSEAEAAGLLQLKGHASVGGMRASLYNAMPESGVARLIEFMRDFEKQHG